MPPKRRPNNDKAETSKLPSIKSKEANPFRLPSDDQIFRLRQEEKERKEEERQTAKTLKIWEKGMKGDNSSRSERMKTLIGDTQVLTMAETGKPLIPDGETAPQQTKTIRRQEKENMTEFIAKKREMFLVQMSLDTKRDEIRKLEEKAQMKEDALQRSEQMLEEDAMRFDAFLKENDQKASDAMKKADEENKRKQEKITQIKQLSQKIQALNSEMSKHREALEDCLRYKEFLDSLTPPEHFEGHQKNLADRQAAIRLENFQRKHKAWEVSRRQMVEQHLKDRQLVRERAKKRITRDEEEEAEQKFRDSIPQPPRAEDEDFVLPWEEPSMYFSNPQQLMDIFAALEEQNLFLIQNSQETQNTLDELRQAYRSTKETMETQTSTLQVQIAELQRQIHNEEVRASVLKAKRASAGELPEADSGRGGVGVSAAAATAIAASTSSEQEKEHWLAVLNARVRTVYERCVADASSKPSTLFMLSQMETKLEQLLANIEKMPQDYVIKAVKEKEKRRRERKREEQQALQERLQEERNRRAIERSMQAPKKRVGRLVMNRSRPIRKNNKDNGDNTNDNANDDELKYLS